MNHRGVRVWQQPWAGACVSVACAAAALATWLLGEPQAVEAWMGESGPVERITPVCYAVAALGVWWARRAGDDWRSAAALSALMVGFCVRELDWHKAFTGTSVLRLSWYAGPASPLAKGVAALAVLSFAGALLWLLWRYARWLLPALLQRHPVAATVVTFVATLVLAKTLDRSVSILVGDFGVDVPLRWVALRSAFEEWLELGLSWLMLLGLLQHRALAR